MKDLLLGLLEAAPFAGNFDRLKLEARLAQLLSQADEAGSPHTIADLIQWLDDMKAQNHFFQKRVGLSSLADWSLSSKGCLSQKNGKFFKVVGIRVTSSAREVKTWDQPILDNIGTGIIGLLTKNVKGSPCFLMQAKAEVGNRNGVQIGPTVQFTQENYLDNEQLKKPFLYDEFHDPRKLIVIKESRQSEEGARFYMEQHVHKILYLPDPVALDLPAEYRWFTYGQIRYFINLGEHVNSCARSILACLL
jgi:oxidase EvaA